MEKNTLLFFITNEEMVNESNHVNGFEGLFSYSQFNSFNKQHVIVVHVDQPMHSMEIINALNSYAKSLEERGIIAGHGYVLPLCGGYYHSKYDNIMTVDNKYRQGGFMMDIWKNEDGYK